MEYLRSPERLTQIEKKLEKIFLRFDELGIGKKIEQKKKELEKLSRQEQRQQTQVNYQDGGKYYSDMMTHYQNQLAVLSGNILYPPFIEQCLSQFAAVDFSKTKDPYQLMSYGHYLLGVLTIIERGLSDEVGTVVLRSPQDRQNYQTSIAKIKVDIDGQLKNVAQERNWSLQEPLPEPVLLHPGDQPAEITDFLIKEENGKKFLTDILTNETIEIPTGAKLVAYQNGLYIFQKDTTIYVRGNRAGEYNEIKVLKIDKVELFEHPSLGKDWLLIVSPFPGVKSKSFGPLAKKEGFEAKIVNGLDIIFINGELLIKFSDTGFYKYLGDAAKSLGIYGQEFRFVSKPLILSDGKFVSLVNKQGKYQLLGDGAQGVSLPKNIEEVGESQVYSQGRWCFSVKLDNGQWRYIGVLNDPYLENALSSDRLEPPLETPDGQLVAIKKDGQNFYLCGQWAVHTSYLFTTPFISTTLPVFLSKDGKLWVIKHASKSPSSKEYWRGSAIDILQKYKFNDAKGDARIKEIDQPQFARDGRWIARVTYIDGTIGYIGPLAEEKNITSEPMVSTIPKILPANQPGAASSQSDTLKINNIVFSPDGQSIDPEDYVIEYRNDNNGVTQYQGPIAERNLAAGITFTPKVRNGRLIIEKRDAMGRVIASMIDQPLPKTSLIVTKEGEVVLDPYYDVQSNWMASRPLHDYFTRMAALYNIPDLQCLGRIPKRQFDLRWQYMENLVNIPPEIWFKGIPNNSPRATLEIALAHELGYLVGDIRDNPSSRYFNHTEIEKIIRKLFIEEHPLSFLTRRALFSGKWIDNQAKMQDSITMFIDFLMDFGFEHLVFELRTALYKNGTNEKIFLEALGVDRWQKCIEAHAKNLRKNYGLEKSPVLDPHRYNPYRESQITDLNNMVILQLPENERTRVREYFDRWDKDFELLDFLGMYRDWKSLTVEELNQVFDYLHKQVGLGIPFDLEVSTQNPFYDAVQLIRKNSASLKVDILGDDGGEYRRNYAKWQETNEKLNAILTYNPSMGPEISGQSGISVLKSFGYEVAHDGVILSFLTYLACIALGKFVVSPSVAKALKNDKRIASSKKVTEEIWKGNPWYNGLGMGEEIGTKEMLEGIIALGKSLSSMEKEEIRQLSRALDPRAKLVLDTILLIAVDAPAQAFDLKAKHRFRALLSLVGVTISKDLSLSGKRQQMNKELSKFIKNINPQISFRDFYKQLRAIIDQYATKGTLPQQKAANLLAPTEFRQRALDSLKRGGKVFETPPKNKRQGINGQVINRPGVGDEFWNIRPYDIGDSQRQINARATARTGELQVNQLSQQAEIPAAILIDMRSLGEIAPYTYLTELVNSIKVLYGEMRGGKNSRSRYQLDGLVFMMPDGNVVLDNRGFKGNLSLGKLFVKVMDRVEKKYTEAYTTITHQEITGLNFYNQQENERYVQRAEEVLASLETGGDITQPLAATLGELSKRKSLNVYVVGAHNVEARTALAKVLSKSQGYYWEGNKAIPLGSGKDAAMLTKNKSESDNAAITPEEKGGIDFNPKNLNLETKGEGIDMPQINFDPTQLEQMNVDGFYPVIYNIVPVTNLPLLLGVAEEKEDKPTGEAQDKSKTPEVSYQKSPVIKESEYELVGIP